MRKQVILARVVIDPADQLFQKFIRDAVPGEGSSCVISKLLRFLHPELEPYVGPPPRRRGGGDVLRISFAGLRWERLLTAEEYALAHSFDLGHEITEPVVIVVDISDGTWESEPLQDNSTPPRRKYGPRTEPTVTQRQRRRQEELAQLGG